MEQTPKQYTEELVHKMYSAIGAIYDKELDIDSFSKQRDTAKQCALICVDEIDNAIDFDWMEVQNLDREHAFYEAVKNEINKL